MPTEDAGGISAADLAVDDEVEVEEKSGEGDETEPEEPTPASEDTVDDETESVSEDEGAGETKEETEEEAKETPQESQKTSEPELVKKLSTKYPNILKEFPEVRSAIYYSKQMREVFPSAEDAAVSAQKSELLDELGSALFQGNPLPLLDSIHDSDPSAIVKLTDNFLPSLATRSDDLFKRAIKPVMVQLVSTVLEDATQSNDENLKITALNLSKYLFGTEDLNQVDLPQTQHNRQPDPERIQLENERRELFATKFSDFYGGLKSDANKVILDELFKVLDPEKSMAKGLKQLIAEKALDEVSRTLQSNKEHVAKMASLRNKAIKHGFTADLKPSILNAYLGSVRQVLPAVRARIKAEVLGKPEAPAAKTNAINKGASVSKKVGRSGNVPPAEKVDWSKIKDDKQFLFADEIPVRKS